MATQLEINEVGAFLQTYFDSSVQPSENGGDYDAESSAYQAALSGALGLLKGIPKGDDGIDYASLDLTKAEDVEVLKVRLGELSGLGFNIIANDYGDDGELRRANIRRLRGADVSEELIANIGVLVGLSENPDILDSVQAVSSGLNTQPVAAAVGAPALSEAGEGGETTPAPSEAGEGGEANPLDDVMDSVVVVEQFLNNAQLRSQLTSNGVSEPVAVQNAEDGLFDSGSQAALQQLLGLLVSEHVLNIKERQYDNGLLVYTPDVGAQIFSKLSDPNLQGPAGALRQQLEVNENLTFLADDGTEYRGLQALKLHLDRIYNHKNEKDDLALIARLSNASSIAPQFSGIQAAMLKFAVQFLAQNFPDLLTFFDGMARDYLGYSLFDLADEFQPGLSGQVKGMIEESNPALARALLGRNDMTPAERAEEQYLTAFGGIDDPAERASQLETVLNRSEFMEALAGADRGPLVTQAVEAAFAQAEAARIAGATAEAAANIFAEHYTALITQIDNTQSGPQGYGQTEIEQEQEQEQEQAQMLQAVQTFPAIKVEHGNIFVLAKSGDGQSLVVYDVTEDLLSAGSGDPNLGLSLSAISNVYDAYSAPADVAAALATDPEVQAALAVHMQAMTPAPEQEPQPAQVLGTATP